MRTAKTRAKGRQDDPAHWSHDLLTAAEERILARRAKDGDRAARDELILKNQKLVVSVARRFVRNGRSLDDLVSAGNEGLFHAVDRFDPNRGLKFSTYATRWIRCFLGRHVEATDRTVHVPAWVVVLVSRYRRAESALISRGADASFGAACDEAGIAAPQRDSLAAALLACNAEHLEASLCEIPGRRDDGDPDGHSVKSTARALLAKLPRSQAMVVRMHHGIGGNCPEALSLEEIARRQRTSVKRIERNYETAIWWMRRVGRNQVSA